MNVNVEAPAQAGAPSIAVIITKNGVQYALEQDIPVWMIAESDIAGVAYELAVSLAVMIENEEEG